MKNVDKQEDDHEKEDDDELSREDFEKELISIRSKGKSIYYDLVKSGDGFKNNVYKFMSHIWKTENIPDMWDLTTLMQVFKKGCKNSLESYRFVHLKKWMPRVFDGLLFNKMKPQLIQSMSKFQIGAKPGHRPQEHLFVLHSVLSLYKQLGTPLIISTYDISKYFDKHVLLDAQECLANASVDEKCYRLFYKLNRNTTVQVLTPMASLKQR